MIEIRHYQISRQDLEKVLLERVQEHLAFAGGHFRATDDEGITVTVSIYPEPFRHALVDGIAGAKAVEVSAEELCEILGGDTRTLKVHMETEARR